MNTSSSSVRMAAKSIPPIAAPITAGYMLFRGSAATHHSYTLQNSTPLTQTVNFSTSLKWFSTHVTVYREINQIHDYSGRLASL